jgi:hypothetical protein
MEKFPSSPDDAIDSRWIHNPTAVTPRPHTNGRRRTPPKPELDARMREIVNPWLAHDRSAADTLKALVALADEPVGDEHR